MVYESFVGSVAIEKVYFPPPEFVIAANVCFFVA
jgi:hypothetical protein